MILDGTAKSFEVVLSGVVTTNEIPIVVAYVEFAAETVTPAANDTISNGTTAVTVVAAPASGLQRQLKFLSVVNIDTAAAEVTVRLNNSSTIRPIFVVTLAVDEQLIYSADGGFRVYDNAGAIK